MKYREISRRWQVFDLVTVVVALSSMLFPGCCLPGAFRWKALYTEILWSGDGCVANNGSGRTGRLNSPGMLYLGNSPTLLMTLLHQGKHRGFKKIPLSNLEARWCKSSRRQRWNMMKLSTGYWRCCHLMPSFKRHLAIRSRLVPSFANAEAQSGRLSKSRLVSRSACPATCLGVRVSMFPWLSIHQGCGFVPCMIHLRKQSQRWYPEVNVNVGSQMFPEFSKKPLAWYHAGMYLVEVSPFAIICLPTSLTLEVASTCKRFVKWHQVHMLLSTCSSSVH